MYAKSRGRRRIVLSVGLIWNCAARKLVPLYNYKIIKNSNQCKRKEVEFFASDLTWESYRNNDCNEKAGKTCLPLLHLNSEHLITWLQAIYFTEKSHCRHAEFLELIIIANG